MKRYMIPAVTVLVLLVFFVPVMAEETDAGGPPFTAGMVARDLVAADAGGNRVDLLTVGERDKSVIMFTNSSCSACKETLRIIQGAAAGKADLIVVATDFGPFDRIAAYRDSNNFGGTWFQDEEFELPALFDFGFTPAVVVLEKNGKVLFTHGGFNKRRAAAFEKAIQDAVR